ncbi:MAG: BREX system P-loop protein BrxC [Peptoniphilus grossensis]
MKIKNMFYKDIDREINGVIKVDQDRQDAIEQELSEYVITKELKKHFELFFKNYTESLNEPTTNIGVWISGFFGSGKSHFLKILSYILENREVNGIKTVERFREKLKDYPEIFHAIEKSTSSETDTILFNIDIEGPMKKNNTAVMRVFAKMFYKHLGFYGEDLKVAKLEEYIERKGKTEEFRKVFEEKYGEAWINSRDVFDFCQDEVVETLEEVLGMSKESAISWFESTEETNLSIAELVSKMKEYVDKKPDDYRLLFMIDEVGQYVGEDREMLLNLQSLIEKIGSVCLGKVWVVCTGQEALDKIIQTRQDEFSRIQARFSTRLSLSSSSADEVIQKRILKKTEEAREELEELYQNQKNVMDNLFKFKEAVGDIRGFENAEEFSVNFPFVPYQFILMQKVFPEIRKHGNAGKHLSGGERSMLSGFQEAAQKVSHRDEYTVVPFWMFYDTVHTFLDSSIRMVIERAEKASTENRGLREIDVEVLKLLYMIRYVDDVPANIENILIMMADDIRVDKIEKRKEIEESIARLIRENYIAKTGDLYNFLTDEEQDIEKEIQNEIVDQSEIIRVISEMIFEKIYTNKKLRYNKKYDFEFDKKVDGVNYGNPVDGLKLEILTIATSIIDKNEMSLMPRSYGQVTAVLSEKDYYSFIENALKIEKFAKKKNIQILPSSMQNIIKNKQDDAENLRAEALEELVESFKNSTYYVHGQKRDVKGENPQDKIDQALKYLVESVYSKLDYITWNLESEEEIYSILNYDPSTASGIKFNDNEKALIEVENFIEAQNKMNQPINMADIQKRFTNIPYGWRELDIASLIAELIYDQKIVAKYGGTVIKAENKDLPMMLYKRSETGKTKIEKRENISEANKIIAKRFLRDFFDKMDVADDDDGLVEFINREFTYLLNHYKSLLEKYRGNNYPDKDKLEDAIKLLEYLLQANFDNIALTKRLMESSATLEDMKEEVEDIEYFFQNQVAIFDRAVNLLDKFKIDNEYFVNNEEYNDASNKIRLMVIVNPKENKFNYRDIPKLNDLIQIVEENHRELLEKKREEVKEIIRQCMEDIHAKDEPKDVVKNIIHATDKFYTDKKREIDDTNNLRVIDGFIKGLWEKRDDALRRLEDLNRAEEGKEDGPEVIKHKNIKKVLRENLLPPVRLQSEEEIKRYLKNIEIKLIKILEENDGIEI